MFIRTKTIKGKKYYYLVENHWTAAGSRQKVLTYLGNVSNFNARLKKLILKFFSKASLSCKNPSCHSDQIKWVSLDSILSSLKRSNFDIRKMEFYCRNCEFKVSAPTEEYDGGGH